MNRKYRLTRSTDFKRVRRTGKAYAHPLVVLITNPAETGSLRIGVAAGKSVGGAVQRNRVKRLLREAARGELAHLKPGWDMVLLARTPSSGASLAEITSALRSLMIRAGIYCDDSSNRVS
jgi:ribonuclease P protein component